MRWGSMTMISPLKWPKVCRTLPKAICNRCASATQWLSNRLWMAGSVAIKGKPLANSKPFWLRVRFIRMPLTHKALSLISCHASRGSTRSPGISLQDLSKSHVPSLRYSGMSSQIPTRVPETLLAKSCRTPRSISWGALNSRRTFSFVRWVSTFRGAVTGQQRYSFFLKAIFRDNPFNTSDGDKIPILVQFLSDDFRRHVGIEKSIPDDLTHDLMGSPVVPFGSGFEAFQPLRTLVHKLTQDLVVTLSRIAK